MNMKATSGIMPPHPGMVRLTKYKCLKCKKIFTVKRTMLGTLLFKVKCSHCGSKDVIELPIFYQPKAGVNMSNTTAIQEDAAAEACTEHFDFIIDEYSRKIKELKG